MNVVFCPSTIPRMHRVAIILMFALPIALRAQQASQSADVSAPNGVARTFLSFGTPFGGWILMALDSIPEKDYSFRPTAPQQTIGFVAQHLEGANYGLCTTFGSDKHVPSAKDSVADTLKAQWPKDTLIARVRASLVFCATEIRKLSDAQLADEMIVDTPTGPVTVRRARYLLLLVTDLAEHYSQLASYMRQLGLVPPSALSRPKA